MVYRIKNNDGWSRWDYPAYPFLQRQWENRFDPALKTHDQLELVGDNLYWTAKSVPGSTIFRTQKGRHLPSVQSCVRVIEMVTEETEIDSFQLAVYIERLRVDGNGNLSRLDSALFYPKYSWNE